MRCILLLMSFFLVTAGSAQDFDQSVGVKYAFGTTSVYVKKYPIGGGTFLDRHYNTYGVTYFRNLNKALTLYTGFSWMNGKTAFQSEVNPSIPQTVTDYTFDLLYVPTGIKFNFFKYFFVSGQAIFTFDVSKNSPLSNQSGIGVGMNIGVQYVFDNGLGLYVAPYLNQHALILYKHNKYPQSVSEEGFMVGVNYNF